MSALLDAPPLWLVFIATAGIILLGIELGYRGGVHRARQSEDERQAPIDVMSPIADLDRPQEGLLRVSQQALLDLQARMH